MNTPKIRIRKGPEIEWIAAYRGNNGFLLSLQAQSAREGLSPNQITRVRENMAREQLPLQGMRPQVTPLPSPIKLKAPDFSVRIGDQIELKHFCAKRIADEKGLPHAFRNLEIIEVLRESAKAIQVRVKYVSKIANSCHLCGLALDTEISRACGIGPTCAEKLGFKRPKVTDAAAILAELEKMAESIGTIGPVWIPKSQIRDTAHLHPEADIDVGLIDLDAEFDRQFAERENRQEQEAFRRKEDERARKSE